MHVMGTASQSAVEAGSVRRAFRLARHASAPAQCKHWTSGVEHQYRAVGILVLWPPDSCSGVALGSWTCLLVQKSQPQNRCDISHFVVLLGCGSCSSLCMPSCKTRMVKRRRKPRKAAPAKVPLTKGPLGSSKRGPSRDKRLAPVGRPDF